jgi:putative tricarboxylic transport membrane protein
VSFDYRSFTPIMKVGDDYTLAVVEASSPWKTCSDAVTAARTGKVVAAVSGATSLDKVVFSLTEQVLAALLGKQIQIASLNPGEVVEQLKAGKLRALCAFADKRYEYPELKDIPTAKEQGVDVAYAQFRGLIATGGITDAEKAYWVDAAKKFVESPEAQKYIEDNYLQPNALFGDDFTAYLKSNSDDLKKALAK